ncbi:MAG: DUF3343 domain-containing protein [Rikenellaceae bacterium]
MCYIVITFKNSRDAIKADNACRAANLNVQVIATPVDISSECGMSIKAGLDMKDSICALLEMKNIEYKKLF